MDREEAIEELFYMTSNYLVLTLAHQRPDQRR